MGMIAESEMGFVQAVSRLSDANPFLPQRIELERAALGDEFVAEKEPYWSLTPDQTIQRRGNLIKIVDRARIVAESLRQKLHDGQSAADRQLELYDDLVLYILFYEQLEVWGQRGTTAAESESRDLQAWKRYSHEFDYWMNVPEKILPSADQKVHLFGVFFQIYRAFFNIFECVIGQSLPTAKLRARIWQSIFTHDLRRYRRSLYQSLSQVTTLISGPSGSGKELVAQAIGMSRFIPFEPRKEKFATHFADSYFAINISAFSKNLIESELFGHAKGAFTGASGARTGWLETCGMYGSILLDEIGELDITTQVKLLRVLQNRQYQRIGESQIRGFQGKFIAATNRDLRREIEAGKFREDLYYRLCSDVIETPSLVSQVRDNSEFLGNLVAHLAGRIAPEEQQTLTDDVMKWLKRGLPAEYAWPGNIRELEQCIRNIMICGEYRPPASASVGQTASYSADALALLDQMQSFRLTASEVLSHYCRMAYRKTKSFEKTAKLLQLDRRTVRAKVDLAEGVDSADDSA